PTGLAHHLHGLVDLVVDDRLAAHATSLVGGACGAQLTGRAVDGRLAHGGRLVGHRARYTGGLRRSGLAVFHDLLAANGAGFTALVRAVLFGGGFHQREVHVG